MRPLLSTPDLDLRPVTPADAPAMAAHLSDARVSRMLRVIPHPLPDGFVDGYVARLDFDRGPEHVWAIRLRGDTGLIGVVAAVRDGDAARLGYWLAPAHWGRGLMGQAVGAVVAALFEGGVASLKAGVFADNAASRRLLQRQGFVFSDAPAVWNAARGADVPYAACRLDRVAALA